MGINQLHYEETLIHSERDIQDRSDFNNFTYAETLDLRGTGFT